MFVCLLCGLWGGEGMESEGIEIEGEQRLPKSWMMTGIWVRVRENKIGKRRRKTRGR